MGIPCRVWGVPVSQVWGFPPKVAKLAKLGQTGGRKLVTFFVNFWPRPKFSKIFENRVRKLVTFFATFGLEEKVRK